MRKFRIILFVTCVITVLTGANKKPVINDSSIVEIIKVANLSELDLARLAKNKSENHLVETFANKVINEQSADLSKLHHFVKRKTLDFTESKMSKELEMRGMARFDQLEVLKGKSFDKAYIDTMVAMYINMQDQVEFLIPTTEDVDLESLLIETKADITKYLDRAKQIQESFTD